MERGRFPVTGSMNARHLIAGKRDGRSLTDAEIRGFIAAFVAEEVADYQMSAFLMAVYLRGMTGEETAALTRAMVDSGVRLDLSGIPGTKVDKHSTGGVGDKVSIPLAPLVAAAGVPVPMVSGRGLGHTGGTLDKLESIPGFRTRLDTEEFVRVLSDAGYVMGGQTRDVAPADRRMYALRDVTATVESIPLIVSSILSKKVAEGAEGLVMDVKCGRGAFMADEEDAAELGAELGRVGRLLGLRMDVFVTDMDRPLGRSIGHSVEIAESIELLKGGGPGDLREITLMLGASMLVLGGVAGSNEEARTRLEQAIADGSGLEKFRRVIELQGGDPRVLDDPSLLPSAPVEVPFESPESGFLADLDPRRLGEAVIQLGGGRRRTEDDIDHGVGILLDAVPGESVERGRPLLRVRARSLDSARTVIDSMLRPAVRISPDKVRLPSLIRRRIAGQ